MYINFPNILATIILNIPIFIKISLYDIYSLNITIINTNIGLIKLSIYLALFLLLSKIIYLKIVYNYLGLDFYEIVFWY